MLEFFDIEDKTFICCIRSALRSGIHITKVKCAQCRNGPRHKCQHELACMKTSAEAGMVEVNDNGEMKELAFHSDDEDKMEEDDFEEALESESSYGDIGSDVGMCSGTVEVKKEEGVVDGNESMGVPVKRMKYTRKSRKFFSGEKLRPLYMCPSEWRITGQLTDAIETWERHKRGISQVDANGMLCLGSV